MQTATAHAYPADNNDNANISGIRTRVSVDSFIGCDDNDNPSTVHFELMGRRVYIGVLFPTGIIASETWEADMRASDVPACLVTSTSTWLAQRAI